MYHMYTNKMILVILLWLPDNVGDIVRLKYKSDKEKVI